MIETRDVTEVVREVVTRLRPKYRDALIVYYFRDRNVRESTQIL